MKRCKVDTFDAYEVNVNLRGNIDEYAFHFLKIFNTVKVRDELIRVTNDYENGVQVVCIPEALEDTKKWLSYYGDVTYVDKVLCAQLAEDIDYDFDEYEDMVIVPYFD